MHPFPIGWLKRCFCGAPYATTCLRTCEVGQLVHHWWALSSDSFTICIGFRSVIIQRGCNCVVEPKFALTLTKTLTLSLILGSLYAQEVEVEDLPDDFEEHATLHHRLNAGGGDGSEPLLA